MQTKDAQLVWNRLSGIVCVYKPPMVSWKTVLANLCSKICGELNEMECRPQRPHVNIMGNTSEKLIVDVHPSYADHPLALGPRYLRKEMKTTFVKPLGSLMSGVAVVGINDGVRAAVYLRKSIQVSTYRITGQLGVMTDDKKSTGEIVFRCKSRHIQRHHLDKTVATIEANQKKNLFALTDTHPQSQAAYDMLSQGLARPVHNSYPLLYSIKCVELNWPQFTIEVVSANENEPFLIDLVADIGARLKNAAVTSSIQSTRCGYFSLEDALLKKHWTLEHILANMARCDKILKSKKEFTEFLHEMEKEEMAKVYAHEDDVFDENEENENEEKQMKKM